MPPSLPELPGVEHRFESANGIRMHYAEAGDRDADPVVLLHGWPQHWWMWRDFIGPLAERFRVICPDIRGQGWSEGPGIGARREHYSLHRLAGDLFDLLDQLGVERTRFAGADWGSAIGYRAYLERPERFEQAINIAAVHPWSGTGSPLLYVRPWNLYAYAVLGGRIGEAVGVSEACLRWWRHAGAFTPVELATYTGRTRTPQGMGATRAFDRNILSREIAWFSRHYRTLRLRVPVLHLNGADDPLTVGVPLNFQRHADDMRLEIVPDCGHFLAEERPEKLLDRMLRFYSTSAAAADATAPAATASAAERTAVGADR